MPIHQISQEQRKKRLSPAQHNGAFPLLPVCENGFQTSLVSIPFGLADCCSNHSIDFNVNNKISALVSILVLILILVLVQEWSKVYDLCHTFCTLSESKNHWPCENSTLFVSFLVWPWVFWLVERVRKSDTLGHCSNPHYWWFECVHQMWQQYPHDFRTLDEHSQTSW